MKRILYLFVTLSLLFPGCNYLDIVPENDIKTIETIFEKREDADLWLKSCYSFQVDPLTSVIVSPAYTGADEVVAGEYIRSIKGNNVYWNGFYIGDGLQMAHDPYGNIWKNDQFYAAIRYCNTFLDKIGGVFNMKDEEKTLWSAEIKAEKALFYFELMRRYGPIILVPENIETNVDISHMQQPRRPIDTCVKVIVNLLDEAMKILPHYKDKEQSRQGYHCLESAAAIKALTLFYAASPLFNGNPSYSNFKNKNGELLFPAYDKERWKVAAEAIDEAIRIAHEGGKELIQGYGSKSTKLLNTMADIEQSVQANGYQNKEAIYMIRQDGTFYTNYWYTWTLPYFKSGDLDHYNRDARGVISPSIKMVEMYYTENGVPIAYDNSWNIEEQYQLSEEVDGNYRDVVALNTDVLYLHRRREPRFYAHIAADRCYWQRGKLTSDNLLVEPYYNERFGSHFDRRNSTELQNQTGYWMKKGTYSELSTRDYHTDIKGREEPIVYIRLAELYLMQAEAWNEYEGPLVNNEHVYEPLNKIRRRAGIPDVVDAWENYTKVGNKAKDQIGMREIIRHEWNVEFAFEGKRFWNLRRWLTAAEELNSKQYGWNIVGSDARQFYNNFEGPIVVWEKRKFVSPRDYLFPLRSEEVMVSGCVQNPGW